MRVENVQALPARAGAEFKDLCTFSLRLNDELVLYGLRLTEAPDGNVFIKPPDTMSGSKAWSMAPNLRARVAELASEAMDQAFMMKMSKLASIG